MPTEYVESEHDNPGMQVYMFQGEISITKL